MQCDAVNNYFPKINPQCYQSQKNTSSEDKKVGKGMGKNKKKKKRSMASLNNANKSFCSEARRKSLS